MNDSLAPLSVSERSELSTTLKKTQTRRYIVPIIAIVLILVLLVIPNSQYRQVLLTYPIQGGAIILGILVALTSESYFRTRITINNLSQDLASNHKTIDYCKVTNKQHYMSTYQFALFTDSPIEAHQKLVVSQVMFNQIQVNTTLKVESTKHSNTILTISPQN